MKPTGCSLNDKYLERMDVGGGEGQGGVGCDLKQNHITNITRGSDAKSKTVWNTHNYATN